MPQVVRDEITAQVKQDLQASVVADVKKATADEGWGVPAALPSILSGLKIGWAFAWRTLIAAELVFGASSGKGGLGWYIFQNRNELYTDKVFAGLVLVILIGLAVESLGFHTLERLTVRRWGVQR